MKAIRKEIEQLRRIVGEDQEQPPAPSAPVEFTPEQIEMVEDWLSKYFADPNQSAEELAAVPPLPPPFEFINDDVAELRKQFQAGCPRDHNADNADDE